MVAVEENRVAGDQVAALAGFRAHDVFLKAALGLHDFIGVADPALGNALVGGKLNGQVGDQRQNQKKRHCGQQNQTIGSQSVPRTQIPRGKTDILGIGSRHGRECRAWLWKR